MEIALSTKTSCKNTYQMFQCIMSIYFEEITN